ncbi:putative methyltransferase [Asanoa ishikariensis]|uniref:Ubiquinone/menaquinone biosynthesis C-methylase UbiE n=1 Tax=Asanoa ishikariensis TaxID=137265 RepID=A0A1H3UV14_9ACTN|nr:class I SAM-dependent methyltransferase [Asanoa ishikariensis]GIF65104.1 putative methyltransferase [Asanoa ishikariensis]SDZ66254.1 Ubiquinone/menaquinone biosynthesis C-methylase UbiE [Asanoa ishikariensis]
MDAKKRKALSFGAVAVQYDRFRPPYPRAALEWAVGGPAPRRVVDLGAGTGILTRGLIAAGYEVTAVEPDPEMRAQLAAATHGRTALAGSAEDIPLPDRSVDAVIAGQAYHWFDPDVAHAEAARVLRPGGYFAAVWNLRDRREPWVAALDEITTAAGDQEHDRPTSFGAAYAAVEHREFTHETSLTGAQLVEMMTTRSYYLTAEPDVRKRFEAELTDLAETHPDLAGRDSFPLPYQTVVYRASTLRS